MVENPQRKGLREAERLRQAYGRWSSLYHRKLPLMLGSVILTKQEKRYNELHQRPQHKICRSCSLLARLSRLGQKSLFSHPLGHHVTPDSFPRADWTRCSEMPALMALREAS